MSLLRKLLCLFVVLASSPVLADDDDGEAVKLWQEVEFQFPAAPRPENLQGFYVGAATENRFFIDVSSLSVGGDGVVRYTLVILSPEGARNVTFEGMRCETKERRVYASGRLDGSWSKSRVSQWSRIQEVYGNRHHAALFLEYFCPDGVIVNNAEQAREALRKGGHPSAKRW